MKLLLAKLIVGIAISAVIGVMALAVCLEPIAMLCVVSVSSLVLGTLWACSVIEQEDDNGNK